MKVSAIIIFISFFLFSCGIKKFSHLNSTQGLNDRVGVWIYFYEDGGVKRIEKYKNGLLHGKFVEYHENSKVAKIGRYNSGKKTGVWKLYYSSGSLGGLSKYKNDLVIKSKLNNLKFD